MTINEMYYDNYIMSGGSDECMRNSMNGNCGINCNIFGRDSECLIHSELTDEQLIKAYHEGYAIDEIRKYFKEQEKTHLLEIN